MKYERAILKGGPADGKTLKILRGVEQIQIPIIEGWYIDRETGHTVRPAFGANIYSRSDERDHGRIVFR